MGKKYRIKRKHDGCYYPQFRFMFIWIDFESDAVFSNEINARNFLNQHMEKIISQT